MSGLNDSESVMTRPNINVSIPGVRYFSSPPSAVPSIAVFTARNSTENTAGTSRHKPRGWISPTSYTITATYRQGCFGTREVLPLGGGGYRYSGLIGPAIGSPNPLSLETECNRAMTQSDASEAIEQLNQLAILQARANLKGMRINLGQAFGERNQTARLIGDTASRLARAYRSLRRGNPRDAMRALGLTPGGREPRGSSVPRKWLELQYGWKPLLSDVYGACDALSKRSGDDWSVVAKGSGMEQRFESFFAIPSGSSPEGSSVSARSETGAFCRIDAYPSGAITSSLASVGVTNPINLAWELLPFSFVVDWFLPLGPWLDSMDATAGFTIRGSSLSRRVRATWSCSGTSGVLSNGTKVTNDWSGGKTSFWLSRSVNISFPRPQFPRLKDPGSFRHMADGLALLTQAFR